MRRMRTRQAIRFLRRRYGFGCRQTLYNWRKRGLPYCSREDGVYYFDDHLEKFASDRKLGRPKGER
jgi:hypothetical protein